jgi:hypothetical protein
MLKNIFTSKPVYNYNIAICCIVKNEDAYLPEWIEYHRSIGVEKFFVYDNESTIPLNTTLNNYINKGIVTVEPMPGKVQQMLAYGKCLAENGNKCKWIAFIDIDEFIVPKNNTGNLADFLMAYENYGGLGINWMVFGSNEQIEKPAGLQIQNFTKRTLKTHPINTHIKSVVQPRHVSGVPGDPHHFIYKKGMFCVNENFERIDGPLVTHNSNKIQLNHYLLRSLAEYKEKISRGRADADIPRKLEFFYDHDKDANLITDESILEMQMIVKNALELQNPGI